ncbi:MAG TPA: glycosyltransferase 87 family protein [Bryobacteraceae bacterium]|nr:glycosyltransferase 87 family protein [Bryobacteraceae bacterium]
MSSIAQIDAGEIATRSAVEIWFRRILLACAVLAGIAILCHVGLIFWTQNEFSAPESIVATQSQQLAQHGRLYYALKSYPYTACLYMPQFYLLEAAISKLGLTTRLAGRLLSFAAMFGMFALVWRLLLLYTSNRNCARLGVVLCASTSLIPAWGSIGQVDMLAVFWSVCAFDQFSRYWLRREPRLAWAGVCIVLALFTKQTAIACPAAIFLLLWSREKLTAIKFAAAVGVAAAAIGLLVNWVFGGHFFLNVIRANMNQLAWDKLAPHLQYMLIAAAQLALIALVGIKAAKRAGKLAPFLYLALAFLVLLATAPKLGSDSNYQIESTVLLVICSSVALDALNFFPLIFSRSRSWLTLLQLPLAIHLVQNFRIAENLLVTRAVTEQLFRAQTTALSPYLGDGRPILSSDFNALARFRGVMDVEPFIYSQLVKSGVIDPEPVRRDIADRAFSSILLYEDLNVPNPDRDPELTTFTETQLDAMRAQYRIVAHVPGPYQDGIFVYKPR